MVNYNNGKIYKIEPVCEHDEGDIYIGSTTKNYLSQRMVAHRNGYNTYKKCGSRFMTSYKLFDKYGIENCKIYLLESVDANSIDELMLREGHYIRTLQCVNKNVVGRTKKEYWQVYYQEHNEELRERNRVYYHDHIEEERERRRLYHQDHIEEERERNRVYYQVRIEEEKERGRVYREKNCKKIKIKFVCECGSECRIRDKSRHNKSIKHKTYLSSLQP